MAVRRTKKQGAQAARKRNWEMEGMKASIDGKEKAAKKPPTAAESVPKKTRAKTRKRRG